MSRRRLVAFAVAATLLAGCTAGGSGHSTAGSRASAAGQYGVGPSRDPGVEYQPDVVLLSPAAIRRASADGLTWYIARSAEGADQLRPGKVMYASSVAVGRVVRVVPDGDTLAVTAVPVGLGEVIRNGRLRMSQDVDLAKAGFQSVPEYPGAVTPLPGGTPAPGGAPGQGTAPSSDAPSEAPSDTPPTSEAPSDTNAGDYTALPALPRLAPSAPAPLPPPFRQGSASWRIAKWSGTVTRRSGDVWLHIEHPEEGFKAYIDMRFHFVHPHVDATIGVADGEVYTSGLRLSGLRQVVLQIKVGSVNGLSDNVKQKIEVPVSLNIPFVLYGVAMNLGLRFKFLAESVFTARNSTLYTVGDWEIHSPLAYESSSGKLTLAMPKATSRHKFIDSLTGVSLGVNGFVFTGEMKVVVGLGAKYVTTGPYARVDTSVAVTVGSSLGLIRCRQVTVTVTTGVGVAAKISDEVTKAVDWLLRGLGVSKKLGGEKSKDLATRELYKTSFWSPDLPVCRLG